MSTTINSSKVRFVLYASCPRNHIGIKYAFVKCVDAFTKQPKLKGKNVYRSKEQMAIHVIDVCKY